MLWRRCWWLTARFFAESCMRADWTRIPAQKSTISSKTHLGTSWGKALLVREVSLDEVHLEQSEFYKRPLKKKNGTETTDFLHFCNLQVFVVICNISMVEESLRNIFCCIYIALCLFWSLKMFNPSVKVLQSTHLTDFTYVCKILVFMFWDCW